MCELFSAILLQSDSISSITTTSYSLWSLFARSSEALDAPIITTFLILFLALMPSNERAVCISLFFTIIFT